MAFPTTFKSLQDQVFAKSRLQDSTANRGYVKDFINSYYAHVCVETECLQGKGTMTLTPNESSYVLDASVIRIKQMVSAAPGSAYGPPLVSAALDEILELRETGATVATNNGVSTRYALVGMNQLEFWPTPANADTVTFYYVRLPTALSADGDVPVLQEPWPKVLEAGALYEASIMLKDPDILLFRDDYERWLVRFRAHLSSREGGPGRQLRVVGAPRPPVGDPSRDRGFYN